MSANIAEQKSILRRELKAEGKRHSASERAIASQQLCEVVKAHPAWMEARAVLFYMPLADEPDISELISVALASGKATAFPRYTSDELYIACRVQNPGAELCPGPFGIREPLRECPQIELNRLDLLLIPGIGFSFNGRRLGRGKGHYDRLLAEVRGKKCGVAFDWQVTVEVPAERHDILLDCIVTPAGWHAVS